MTVNVYREPVRRWTRFRDSHSGGYAKLKWEAIYIETTEERAIEYFAKRFDMSPFAVGCECCGPNYSSSDDASLEAVSFYDRKIHTGPQAGQYIALHAYISAGNVLIIHAENMK